MKKYLFFLALMLNAMQARADDPRISRIVNVLERLDQRMDNIEGRLSSMESRLQALEVRYGGGGYSTASYRPQYQPSYQPTYGGGVSSQRGYQPQRYAPVSRPSLRTVPQVMPGGGIRLVCQVCEDDDDE